MKLFPVMLLLTLPLTAEGQDGDFRDLFNGKDLTGWKRVNTDESTWSIRDGMLVCTGRPIGELRTERMYQNFIMEVEWRHMKPKGNAGIFVWADDITARGVPFHRGIEVQVLENAYGNNRSHTTHGDIFPIHGATMTPINGHGGSRAFPTEQRSRPSPEWNHYRIECNDGKISLAVNGKVVTRGEDCSPRKGYICIESEGGVVHYRNMRIQELPDTPVDPEHVAIADRGYRCLYTGIDLNGWQASGDGHSAWRANDWELAYESDKGVPSELASTESFEKSASGFIVDVRFKEQSGPCEIEFRGTRAQLVPDMSHLEPMGRWNRVEGVIRDNVLTLFVNGEQLQSPAGDTNAATGRLVLRPEGPTDFTNIYVREQH